jgi:hypothetical protein
MWEAVRHWRWRELRFLALVVLTALVIALQLHAGLHLAGREGVGWRSVDTPRLRQRIDSGELREHEASWYHRSSDEERRQAGSSP